MNQLDRKSNFLRIRRRRYKNFLIRKSKEKHLKGGSKLRIFTGKNILLNYLCSMGVLKKPALGPNPLSNKRRQNGGGDGSMLKKRRKRSGKRSRELS